jgi:hypothetical protein
MLSKTKYATLCVLGTEIFYALCLGYGVLLSENGRELHRALFKLIPGFMWGHPVRTLWGAVFLGLLAFAAGWYVAWMHNVSLVSGEKRQSKHVLGKAA